MNLHSLHRTLTNIYFLVGKCELGFTHSLVDDFCKAIELFAPLPPSFRRLTTDLTELYSVLRDSASIIALRPQLLLQQFHNSPGHALPCRLAHGLGKRGAYVGWDNKGDGFPVASPASGGDLTAAR